MSESLDPEKSSPAMSNVSRSCVEDSAAHDHHGHHDHAAHHHGEGGGHHHHTPINFGRIFFICLTINTIFVFGEAVCGLWINSLSLISDAGHNLSDLLGLGGAWLAYHLARREPSERFTYGLKRSTILSALGNAMLLLFVTGGIVVGAIMRILHPQEVPGWGVIITALIGLIVNGSTALLLMRGSHDDLNMRGAFLHMVSDAAISAGVAVTGVAILLTGWSIFDPIVSLVISVLIVISSWGLLRASLDMTLDAVPRNIDSSAVGAALRDLPGVRQIHHMHIWPLSTTEAALTVHLVVSADIASRDDLLQSAAGLLRTRFRIGHATFQLEDDTDAPPCGHVRQAPASP